jgi:ribosomal protein S27E
MIKEIITIEEIRTILADETTVFMKQGKSGKFIHISAGDCRNNNLLHGVTYARNGSRASYIYSVSYTSLTTDVICKKCLAVVTEKAGK